MWHLLIITLYITMSMSAIIPKGVSSLLSNNKVPNNNEIFSKDSSSSISSNIIGNDNNNHLVDNNRKISSLSKYKDTFGSFTDNYINDQSTGLVLTSSIISDNLIQKLGIKGSTFKLPNSNNQNDNTIESIFLPSNCKSMFLFNIEKPININMNSKDGKIPFDIKGNYKIDDYNLIIPFQYLQKLKISSISLENFLIEGNKGILYYNEPINFENPVLITSINKNDLINNKLTNLFIELITKNWFQNSGNNQNNKVLDLLDSRFCFINNETDVNYENNNSICVRVNDETITFAPAFNSLNRLNLNGIFGTNPLIHDKRGFIMTTVEQSMYNNHTTEQLLHEVEEGYRVKSSDKTDIGSFKIQVGNNTLSDNSDKFHNNTACREERAYTHNRAVKVFQTREIKIGNENEKVEISLREQARKSFMQVV